MLGEPTLHSDTSFLGTVVVRIGEIVNTLYCLCGSTLILKDLQMDRAEATTSLTLRRVSPSHQKVRTVNTLLDTP